MTGEELLKILLENKEKTVKITCYPEDGIPYIGDVEYIQIRDNYIIITPNDY